MGDRQSVKTLQWLVYIGVTRDNIVHAGNGREVHLDRVPHVKVDWNCRETNEVFEYLGFFRTDVLPICPIATSPLAKRHRHCKADMRKLWRDCKESAGYKVVSIWGCEVRKLLLQNPGLEKNLARFPM